MSSPSPSLENLITSLLSSDDESKQAIGSEIQVLQSIYGDDSVSLYDSDVKDKIRYRIRVPLEEEEDLHITVLVTLPATYPESGPPQLQLLDRYIGSYGVDSTLFGGILRTYFSTNGVEGEVCVFDGIQNVLERCEQWLNDKERAIPQQQVEAPRPVPVPEEREPSPEPELVKRPLIALPTIHVAPPITDRKSIFIGRSVQITHPSDVPRIIEYLLSDRKIAKAAHPVINAWRCEDGKVLYQDNDDDGESAAGSRLAHLLQILDMKNVLVIVTRYFGGVHLGPDRFRHINQAARDALVVGGFLK